MARSVPGGFYTGLAIALAVGLFLAWLWGAERQVGRHTKNLLAAIEDKNWSRVGDLIDAEYTDQWGNDRKLVLERLREVFSYLRGVRIQVTNPSINVDHRRGVWRAQIKVEGDTGEVAGLLKQRLNSLGTPFELEWRRISAKPWDWKLVHVTNPDLEIPTEVN